MAGNYSKSLADFLRKMKDNSKLQSQFRSIVEGGASASALVQLGRRYGASFTESDVRNFDDVARAWADPDYRKSLSSRQLSAMPAPSGGYQLDTGLLSGSLRGNSEPRTGSEGHLCTVSAECSTSGTSCWPF